MHEKFLEVLFVLVTVADKNPVSGHVVGSTGIPDKGG
jgi:hypothetical protein